MRLDNLINVLYDVPGSTRRLLGFTFMVLIFRIIR